MEKIIVEQGARLIVNNSELNSYCNGPWQGIEVWGSNQAIQDSIGQGVLYLNTAIIKNARVGITTGKRLSNTQIDYSTTGAVIRANASGFVENKNDVEFYPYLLQTFNNTTLTAPVNNKSYFADCYFVGDRNKGNELKERCIYLEGIYDLKLLRCEFDLDPIPTNQPINNSAVAIHAYKSNFRLIGGFNYKVTNFLHGVIVQNTDGGFPVVIDGMRFINNKSNHIVIMNSIGSRVTNNRFSLLNTNLPVDPMTAIYLFESTNYKIENNSIIGVGQTNQIGMYVRNSGPYPNAVYNNTLNALQQGIWAVGKNWDEANGDGLKMNCNTFLNSNYNIGVVDHPTAQFGIDWTGVDRTQGIENTANDFDKVRNTYAAACGGSNEKAFRMDAYNNDPNNYFYIIRHGSFISPTQFQPNPQILNSCSNSSEVVLLSQDIAPATKSIYCPNNSLPLLSKPQLLEQLTLVNLTLNDLHNQINIKIDGGNTQLLLSTVFGNSSAGNKKNTLMAVGSFLSDTVMKAYFGLNNTPPGHLKQVFMQNAPVSPKLWEYITTLDISTGIFNQMQTKQLEGGISGSNDLLSKKIFYLHKQQELYFERYDRFANENSLESIDSTVQFLNSGVLPNSDLLLADYYHTTSQTTLANAKLGEIASKGGAFTNYARLKNYFWSIDANPDLVNDLRNNDALKAEVQGLTHSGSYLLEGMARTLLSQIWNIWTPLEKPVPDSDNGTGARGTNSTEVVQTIIMNEFVKIYPNPASTQLTISAQNNDSKEVRILDLNGKIVLKHNIDDSSTIDVKSLPNGVYLIQLLNGNTINSTNKIIILK